MLGCLVPVGAWWIALHTVEYMTSYSYPTTREERDWYFFAEQPAQATHLTPAFFFFITLDSDPS